MLKKKSNGLIKVYWSDIRSKVAKVEPKFAAIVDELDPDQSFPLYLAYYPYGALKGDTRSTFFPDDKASYYRVTDANAPKDVVKHLGYSKNSAPLALLLEKNFELFIDLKEQGITIPRVVYSPGALFPLSRILSRHSERTYAPNGLLTMTAGTRSVFMLPNIGCATNHINLQRDFNVQSEAAKSLYDHWHVFKELTAVDCDWRACLVYFSQNWLDKLYSDKRWLSLRLYLHEMAWHHYEFERNHFYYDVAFSTIQKKRNLKPNPYLADTARHLLITALGAAPGYTPATTEDALPLTYLQNIFIESYGLKKYFPIIFQPQHFNFESDQQPIYYSLQHPSTHMFSPKSRKIASTLSEMRELERITRIYTQELARENTLCSDTVLNKVAQQVKFDYYHNKMDLHKTIKSSKELLKIDTRLSDKSWVKAGMQFAADAPFVRGCVSIKRYD